MAAPRTHPIPSGQSWDWSGARPRCLREARRLLRDPHDAEEAVQEAFMRAWRYRGSCRTPEAPLPWLLQITRNEAMRIGARLRERSQSESGAEPPESPIEDVELEGVIPQLATEQRLMVLSPQDRELVRMRLVEDRPQADVAAALSLSEGTVAVKLHRARARLKRALADAPA